MGALEWRNTSHEAPKLRMAPERNSSSDSAVVGVPASNVLCCSGPGAVMVRVLAPKEVTAVTARTGPSR